MTNTNEKAGVSPEFSFNQILTPVSELAKKVNKALSFKTDDIYYQDAARRLNNCSQELKTILGIKASTSMSNDSVPFESTDQPSLKL